MSISDRLSYLKLKSKYKKQLLPWHKKWWGKIIIILIILFVIILIISAVIIVKKTKEILNERNNVNQEMSIKEYYKTIEGDGTNYYYGPKQSLYKNYLNNKDEGIIDIVIFSNYSCEYSAMASDLINKVKDDYPNVRFVLRDSPTQDSIILSIAARCAGEQGKYWPMHDLIFEMQEEFNLILDENEKKKVLKELAKELDLNKERFNNCLDERRYINKIKKDYEDGEALDIPGTPTWFINGKRITGTLSENDFRELLNGLKSNMNKNN